MCPTECLSSFTDSRSDLVRSERHDEQRRKMRTFCRRWDLTGFRHDVFCRVETMTQIVLERKRFPLGERIRRARKAAGLSTTKLAVELGVDPRTVARWQSDESRPSFERLAELARVLGQPPSYFVEGDTS